MSEKDVVPSDHTDIRTVPKGIAGWLIIPSIGLVLGPIKAIVWLFLGIGMIQNSTPELLSDGRFLESLSLNITMIIATIIVAILFFGERRIAVGAIIGLMVASIIVSVIQLGLGMAIFGQVSSDNINGVLQACIYAAIWIPYFKKSKRVKNTFVN